MAADTHQRSLQASAGICGLLKHEGHEDYTKDTKLQTGARYLCELGATFVFFVF